MTEFWSKLTTNVNYIHKNGEIVAVPYFEPEPMSKKAERKLRKFVDADELFIYIQEVIEDNYPDVTLDEIVNNININAFVRNYDGIADAIESYVEKKTGLAYVHPAEQYYNEQSAINDGRYAALSENIRENRAVNPYKYKGILSTLLVKLYKAEYQEKYFFYTFISKIQMPEYHKYNAELYWAKTQKG